MFTEVYCVVTGKVQQVAYRDFAQRMAKTHALTGWVKNKEDGTVEVLAQGYPDDLKLFIEVLNECSSLSRVDSVGVDWRTTSDQLDDFIVIF